LPPVIGSASRGETVKTMAKVAKNRPNPKMLCRWLFMRNPMLDKQLGKRKVLAEKFSYTSIGTLLSERKA
jgi:hypothetical protein